MLPTIENMIWQLALFGRKFLDTNRAKIKRVTKLRSESKSVTITPCLKQQRLFVDVSRFSARDAGTGIQRIVRSLCAEMDRSPGAWSISRVVLPNRVCDFGFGVQSGDDAFKGKATLAGSVFLGLDLSVDEIRRNSKKLAMLRRQGVTFWFFVYDLLPIEHPEWFDPKLVARFDLWLEATAGLADGYIAVSSHTADRLRYVLGYKFGILGEVLIRTIPMGGDIRDGLERDRGELESLWPFESGFVLAVGTIEPRKGYGQMVAAFERLWLNEKDIKLVIVGRRGWKSQATQEMLTNHPQFGKMLFWFDDINDDDLQDIYSNCFGVLNCSFDEGYGLPLLEVTRYRKPVLARDIAPFREQARPGLSLFPNTDDAAVLADYIDQWRTNWASADNSGMLSYKTPTWSDSWSAVSAILSLKE